jgi:3-hydroxyisobutyrate dehydrogenase-like beta-hydroxyacid dehydrogenase
MTVGPATSPTTIGVLGLGRMGLPIAGWLTRAGFDVSGFDIRAERISLAVDVAGVTPATSAEQLASEVDLVVQEADGSTSRATILASRGRRSSSASNSDCSASAPRWAAGSRQPRAERCGST